MTVCTTETGPVSPVRKWLYGLWEFYKAYVHTAIHAASVATLTMFGLLIFIDPIFAGLAIAAYVCPPLVLYVIDVDLETETDHAEQTDKQVGFATSSATESKTNPLSGNGDTDSDSDSDSDSGDGDSDSDSGDGDSDSDSDQN